MMFTLRFGSAVQLLLAVTLAVGLAGCSGGGSPRTVGSLGSATGGARPVPANGLVTVRPGDTVYGIARRYGISPRTLIQANQLQPPYILRVGTTLSLPVPRVHVVRRGDTVSEIARDYRVDTRSLVVLNNLAPPYLIRIGDRLSLPPTNTASGNGDGTRIAARTPKSPPTPTSPAPGSQTARSAGGSDAARRPWSSGGQLHFPVGDGSSRGDAAPLPVPRPAPAPGAATASARTQSSRPPATARAVSVTPPRRAGARFLWPVDGRLIGGFGPREGGLFNDGINIAAPLGTEIKAAENGVVVYAGNELRGFGNLLLIKHADDWTTAYAHAQRLLVGRGEKVRRGQPIATVGQSGNVGSPQLHFEIRKGPRAVDPRDEMTPARTSEVVTPAAGSTG